MGTRFNWLGGARRRVNEERQLQHDAQRSFFRAMEADGGGEYGHQTWSTAGEDNAGALAAAPRATLRRVANERDLLLDPLSSGLQTNEDQGRVEERVPSISRDVQSLARALATVQGTRLSTIAAGASGRAPSENLSKQAHQPGVHHRYSSMTARESGTSIPPGPPISDSSGRRFLSHGLSHLPLARARDYEDDQDTEIARHVPSGNVSALAPASKLTPQRGNSASAARNIEAAPLKSGATEKSSTLHLLKSARVRLVKSQKTPLPKTGVHEQRVRETKKRDDMNLGKEKESQIDSQSRIHRSAKDSKLAKSHDVYPPRLQLTKSSQTATPQRSLDEENLRAVIRTTMESFYADWRKERAREKLHRRPVNAGRERSPSQRVSKYTRTTPRPSVLRERIHSNGIHTSADRKASAALLLVRLHSVQQSSRGWKALQAALDDHDA